MNQVVPSGDILAVATQLVDALGSAGARIRVDDIIADWGVSTEPDADAVLQWWAGVRTTIDVLEAGRR